MNPLQTPALTGPDLRGDVVRPGDAAYDELRRLQNATLDRRPALIVRAAGADDVAAALAFARAQGLEVAVRGGGHSSFGGVDGAVTIDLRALDHVEVDPSARTVRVGGGASGGAVEAALAAHGLALTTPRFPTVGMAGFTLGSGSGWLERAMGLASDNLRSATVVTADGRVVRASLGEHPDLFWALRGGGGNLGVVTELEFRTMQLGRHVVGGYRAYPFSRVREVLAAYAGAMAGAPDELCGGLVVRPAPPRPDVPAELQGELVIVVIALWAGDVADAEAGLAPLAALGEPLADTIAPLPIAGFQQMLVPAPPADAPPPPSRGHVKFAFVDTLGDAAIDTLVGLCGELCTPQSLIIMQPMGGAIARASATESALGDRDAGWAFQLITAWDDAADDAANIAWTRAAAAELVELGRPASWPNLITEESRRGRLAVPYAPATLARLRDVKRAWDPGNVFRANHNIEPA